MRAAGLNGADIHQRAGHYPAPPGLAAGHPRARARRRGRGARARRRALRRGRPRDGHRRRRRAGRAGHGARAPAHAGPRRPELDRGRRRARGLHHRPRRALHPGRPARRASACSCTAPPAASAPPACSSARRPAPTSPPRCATPSLRDDVAALGAHEVIDPEGFAEHGPFDVVLELVGAPNLAGDLQALATSGRIVVIGIGGGAKAELNLGALMGKRATVRASTLRPRPLEEKALTARAMERHVLPLFERGALRVPVAATYPLDARRPRPTSASRPAASSARSCWSCA